MRIPKPYLKIAPKGFTFNAACMQLMPDVNYIQFRHNLKNGQLFAVECGASDENNIPWRLNCSSREVNAKHTKWPKFYKFICDEMKWIHGNEYTVPAMFQELDGQRLIFFDLFDIKKENSVWNFKLSDLHSLSVDEESTEDEPHELTSNIDKALKAFEGYECNTNAVKKGVSLFESGKVEYQPYDEGIVSFLAKVPDENSTVHHTVKVQLYKTSGGFVDGNCTCKPNREYSLLCKHIVAAALAIQNEPDNFI